MTIPSVALGCLHRCTKSLSVPRHERSTFLNVSIALTTLLLLATLARSQIYVAPAYANRFGLVKIRVLQFLELDTCFGTIVLCFFVAFCLLMRLFYSSLAIN